MKLLVDDNLQFLQSVVIAAVTARDQESGRRALIGTPKSALRTWAWEIAEAKDDNVVREAVAVKLCRKPDGAEAFVRWHRSGSTKRKGRRTGASRSG